MAYKQTVPAEDVAMARRSSRMNVIAVRNGVIIRGRDRTLHVESLDEWQSIDEQVRDIFERKE